MGGFIRRIIRSFSSAPAAPAQVQQVQQVAATKGVSGRVLKPYMDETIMTGGKGIEDEANIQKTVLGGTTKKKKKYKAV